jgi:hypothetical protein
MSGFGRIEIGPRIHDSRSKRAVAQQVLHIEHIDRDQGCGGERGGDDDP